ncbi:MAG: hypothetical protein KAI17_02015, partial [Thiotrichaceae bacterium]|nr:hypothetical protein [Thiotrichaceae bacterium]
MKNFKQTIVIFTICFFFSANSSGSGYVEDARKYFDKGEYNSAIIQLKNHLINVPEDAQARLLLGQSYQKSGNVSGAYKEFEKAYKINKNDSKIQLAYASVLKLKNENEKVKEV